MSDWPAMRAPSLSPASAYRLPRRSTQLRTDATQAQASVVLGEVRFRGSEQLSWGEYLIFQRWKARNPSQALIRPRASWAQLLLAIGILDTAYLTHKHADADLIPSNFDAPMQRIRLHDLGFLALLLGFTTIDISTHERNFEAKGPYGTITTLTLPEVGKVLRFEGDMLAIHSLY